ncbi:kinase-associated lipoprotein B [Metabacillus arenae]|uniref:Kinase-associated lipoprotein B n=1 Tax=Metabacillus arenae TaxID=2771434 RepID=A0A926NRI3_9BACI|nr:kinase-associated lipoprotein B [Metabacillus arenae]MBD1382581.1 kinase-associated lipoprotein B [Metabacillus arenae]
MGQSFQIGDIVKGHYKTGTYVGEVTAVRPQQYLVKIKAVLKHPAQGDLHNHKEADVPLFHERRALALNEQTNIPAQMVRKYEEAVPDYNSSLKNAISELMIELTKDDSTWAKKSMVNLKQLEMEYF